MSNSFVDTNIIIHLLTQDDPRKQAQAVALFQQVEIGALVLETPDTVIADAVYVMASPRLYSTPRADVQQLLTPLVRLTGFRVRNKRAVLRALQLYGTIPRLDFGDAMIVATMEQTGAQNLYSYDRDFDRFAGFSRIEP